MTERRKRNIYRVRRPTEQQSHTRNILRRHITDELGKEIEEPEFVEVDGRKVAYYVSGPENGIPVFLLHGTPGSKLSPRIRPSSLYISQLKIISYDRPGYGDSDRQEGRTVADAARDVETIANKLGLEKFIVVGRSGGAPHALACATLLPDRVAGCGFIRGLSHDKVTLGMTDENKNAFTNTEADLSWMDEVYQAMQGGRLDALLQHLKSTAPLTLADLRTINSVAFNRIISLGHAYGLVNGTDGWKDDVSALRNPWGFDLSTLRVPIVFDHGYNDPFTPDGTQEKLLTEIFGNIFPKDRYGNVLWRDYFHWDAQQLGSKLSPQYFVGIPYVPENTQKQASTEEFDDSSLEYIILNRKQFERTIALRTIHKKVHLIRRDTSHFDIEEDLIPTIIQTIRLAEEAGTIII